MCEVKKNVLVFDSGCGTAGEDDLNVFRFCQELKKNGLKVILVASGPFAALCSPDCADAVYFEPLNIFTVSKIIEKENINSILPIFASEDVFKIVIELYNNNFLRDNNVSVMSITPEIVQAVLSHNGIERLLTGLKMPLIPSRVVGSVEEAYEFACEFELPVYLSPTASKSPADRVICFNEDELTSCTEQFLKDSPIKLIRIEKCFYGWKEFEFEVLNSEKNTLSISCTEFFDLIGTSKASGITASPVQTMPKDNQDFFFELCCSIAREIKILGCCSVRFAIKPGFKEYAVLGVQTKPSPYSAPVSICFTDRKIKEAALCMLGKETAEVSENVSGLCAVYVPSMYGSNVCGVGASFEDALYKAIQLSGMNIKRTGSVLLSVTNSDKQQLVPVAEKFADLGFKLIATPGTAKYLNSNHVAASSVHKLNEESPNVLDALSNERVVCVISTYGCSNDALNEEKLFKELTANLKIPVFSSFTVAKGFAESMKKLKSKTDMDVIDAAEI